MTEQLKLRGILQGGHSGPITQVATTLFSDKILSASKDKSIVVWQLTMDGTNFGVPKSSLVGHSDIVSDVTISSDGMFALSGSSDSTLRLWDITTGVATRVFRGHVKGVRSVALSADNRRIASGSFDYIKLWNTLGQCIHTIIEEDVHTDWITCVRFSNHSTNPILVSSSFDRVVKVWDATNFKLKINFIGHTAPVNSVAISPDGSLCASGGKDYHPMLWDLNQGKNFCTLDGNIEINALVFSPNRYWLCVAAGGCVRIWDLGSNTKVQEIWIKPVQNLADPECTSLAWSADGQMLFAGCTDGIVRVFEVAV